MTHAAALLSAIIVEIAYGETSDRRRACNNDENGESWDFHAAENRMRGHEYFACECSAAEGRLYATMQHLDEYAVRALARAILTPEAYQMAIAAADLELPEVPEWAYASELGE